MHNMGLTIICLFFGAAVAHANSSGTLAVGGNHACMIVDGTSTLKCWGENHFAYDELDNLTDAVKVFAFDNSTCVIQKANKLTCTSGARVPWYATSKDLLGIVQTQYVALGVYSDRLEIFKSEAGDTGKIPLKNPRSPSSSNGHYCVVTDDGIYCNGDNHFGELDTPKDLKGIKGVSTGVAHTCALHSKGVSCWGNNDVGQLDVPLLKNPKSLSAGFLYTCVVDNGDVKCWGDASTGRLKVPPLHDAQFVVAGGDMTCAISKKQGVVCW